MSEVKVSIFLYPGAIALAVFTIVYTACSALAAVFTYALFRMNGKKVDYVSLMSISIFAQQIFTIAHQCVSLTLWPELQMELYSEYVSQWRNPKTSSVVYETSPNMGLKVLFDIRTYFFNVGSLLFFFWSLMLFISVWEIDSKMLKSGRFIAGTKWLCFVLPGIQVTVIHIPVVANLEMLSLILTDLIMILTLSIGCIFLLLILVKSTHVMYWDALWTQKIRFWSRSGYDNGTRRCSPTKKADFSSASMSTTVTGVDSASENEDRYILIRFITGFLIIGGFQASFLLSQWAYVKDVRIRKQATAPEPIQGWTLDEQLSDWAFYLAGSSTGFAILIIFGTTRESRTQARELWSLICGMLSTRGEGEGDGKRGALRARISRRKRSTGKSDIEKADEERFMALRTDRVQERALFKPIVIPDDKSPRPPPPPPPEAWRSRTRIYPEREPMRFVPGGCDIDGYNSGLPVQGHIASPAFVDVDLMSPRGLFPPRY